MFFATCGNIPHFRRIRLNGCFNAPLYSSGMLCSCDGDRFHGTTQAISRGALRFLREAMNDVLDPLKEGSVDGSFFPSNIQFSSLHCDIWRTLPAAISLRAVTISRLSVTRSGFAPFKSCFALFDARITSWNRLVTFSRQSSTVTRAINIPSKRIIKTSDHFALTVILE